LQEKHQTLTFPNPSSLVFLTEHELRTKPWLRLLEDPSLQCLSPDVDRNALQRLKPGVELNDDILNAYIGLCRDKNQKRNSVKLLPTFFWLTLELKRQKGQAAAKRTLIRSLAGPHR
jgi:hypothetical protein